MRNMNYSWAVTLLKGLVAGSGTTGVSAVLLWILDGVNTGDWSMKPETQGIVISLLTGAAAALWTMFKNYAKQKWGWVLPVLVCAVALQGCAGLGLPNTLSKPVEHETKLNITQPPTVNPDGTVVQGESTEYYKKWRGGAGVESTKSDNLRMGIDKDGNWYVEQGEASNLSTQGQVQGIVDGMKLNLEAIMAGYALGQQGLGIAGGLVGQKLQFDATQDATNAANKFQLQSMIADIVKQALAQQAAASRVYGNPLVDLPVVGGDN